MALTLGARLGAYEVVAQIGVGGMGEVYRARDTKLGRDVALKILPEPFASDPDRLSRFNREAQLLASLNHPNIGGIHGLEETDGVRALVLELVEGETLADRIARGPIPVDEALPIAKQIAQALEAAHEDGIIHRDLKPANIKLRPDGTVKVLDFGLAKALAPASVGAEVSQSPTLTSPAMTRIGVILGTAAYMSPEQATGRPLDKRVDVWAFACVLYEMLTGQRAFAGEDVTDTLSRVLQREPDFATLPASTPPAVRRLLVRCFEKDRNKRLPHIAVGQFLIDEALEPPSRAVTLAPVRLTGLAHLIVPALVFGAIAGAAIVWLLAPRSPDARAPVTHLQMGVAPAEEIGGGTDGRPTRAAFALSPDGQTLVFSALQKNQRALFVRPLNQPVATVISGTDGAFNPFFSPDGQWVGYWASGQILKIPLRGGPPVVVVATPLVFGANWGDDDRIVFARHSGGLLEVPSAGGSPDGLTTINSERGEVSHRLPHVLPGGDAVLFTVTHSRFPRWDESQVWVHSRSTGVSKLLIEGGADARYVSSGHILYAREGTLLAVPFDLRRLAVTGGPVGVRSDVMQAAYVAGQLGDTGAMQVSASNTGTMVYITGGVHPSLNHAVLQVDRTGRSEPLPIAPQSFRTLRVSPDGTRLALSTLGRDRSIWLYSFARGTLSKLTAAGRSMVPVWTPDGERITYAGGTKGLDSLHWTRADGGGMPELLIASPRNLVPGAWTPDGRQLLFYSVPGDAASETGLTIMVQDITDKSKPRVVYGPGVDAGGAPLVDVGGADVSPDGRWIAYHSPESGRLEVYVDALQGPGPRFQVSADGGGSPIWRADGRELFYARPIGEPRRSGDVEVGIMVVAVTTQPTLALGTPRQLFTGRYSMNIPARAYDVTSDGQRILFLQARERVPDVITQMNVVQNWIEELK